MPADGSAIARSQAHTFLRLWAELSPHVRTDRALPARLDRLLRLNRQFGSRDRRLYRELVYTTLRFLPWLEGGLRDASHETLQALGWLSEETTATRSFKGHWASGFPNLPGTVEGKSQVLSDLTPSLPVTLSLLPEWFRPECPEAFQPPLYDTLQTRSPLWIRLQTENTDAIAEEFRTRGWTWNVAPSQPRAWRLDGEPNVTDTDAFKAGLFEIQDLGSQTILHEVSPQPGTRWLDACAGAGGKTLQLAHQVGPSGHVTASDIRTEALDELQIRARRSGLKNISVTRRPEGTFDGVLIDAPCSGTGTWRRAPHLKASTTLEIVRRSAALQQEIIVRYARHVRPGGWLIYATCATENESVVDTFLGTHPEFGLSEASGTPQISRIRGRRILPSDEDTDGFYVACLQRSSAETAR
ncbi:MAG TPA: RsmB/NOP family class I SAM-dependent RNA methyltransferase [Opitutaceae bacterium]|nr:RsmB/NOP family class I SAM-dependent RNA methyltransferase [Opitutaceae bacterium]